MTNARLLYVTTKDIAQAQAISEELIARGLIVCANIFPQIQSIYKWKGEVSRDVESVLILKTSADKVEATTRAVEELHSYETPCVLTLPIESGSPAYLRWLEGAE